MNSSDGGRHSLLTRRSWAALVAAVPLLAQTPAAPPVPTSNAVDDVRKVSDQLAQIEVPMSLEPAFQFHV